MITIKSQREIELMRHAGHIVALCHVAMKKAIKPGVSTYELDQICEKIIRENGATPSTLGYMGYPASVCASINEVVVHGIPDKKTILKDGDIITVDICAKYHGYHGDSAWTYEVGNCSESDKELMKITHDSLFAGLEKIKPGVHLSDISAAVGDYCIARGCGVVEDFTGHGIGSDLHEDPAVPNYGKPGHGPILREGMTFCVEPMITAGTKRVKVLKDGWTTITRDRKKAAHYEHEIAVTKDGYRILTVLDESLINEEA